jgi:hypothetical protein
MRERAMTPEVEFQSYYGRPILKPPVWKVPDVPGYLFLGGLAGASAVLAEGAAVTGRPQLERVARLAASAGAGLGTVALIHDLGRPERFHHMLRVLKPTSPLSVGSWILAPFATLSTASAASNVTGLLPRLGRAAGVGAAALGPPLATYTAALLSDTAVPAWHDGYREMPFIFAGSGATAAGGLAMIFTPPEEAAPARRMLVAGAAMELAGAESLRRRLGPVAEPYETGDAGRLRTAAQAMTAVAGAAGLLAGGRSRTVSVLAGATCVVASAMTRFGIFKAGVASAADPKYTVVPQRERLRARQSAEPASTTAD